MKLNAADLTWRIIFFDEKFVEKTQNEHFKTLIFLKKVFYFFRFP